MQLISDTRTGLVDKIASLQRSECGVIVASEVFDILYSAVSKWFCNLAHILAYILNFTSRPCSEVWASHFSFLHSIKFYVPPDEACLNIFIKWLLA